MSKKNPVQMIPVKMPPDLIASVDRHVESARAVMPGLATISRSSMIRELVRLGMTVRQDQLNEQRREQTNHEERRAARLELHNG